MVHTKLVLYRRLQMNIFFLTLCIFGNNSFNNCSNYLKRLHTVGMNKFKMSQHFQNISIFSKLNIELNLVELDQNRNFS